MSSKTNFKHEPFKLSEGSIRILRVLPLLSAEGLIQCEIEETMISEEKYTCLSYVWGDANGTKYPVLLNGRMFYVLHNLYTFLRVARRKYYLLPLWIDAVCIDQTNTREREDQVQEMGRIYREAHQVFSWLGPNPALGQALKLIEMIHGSRYGSPGQDANPSAEEWVENNIQYAFEWIEDFTAALKKYWSRAWITQEVVLAQNLKILGWETKLHVASIHESAFRDFFFSFPSFQPGPELVLAMDFWKMAQSVCLAPAEATCNDHNSEQLMRLLTKTHFKRCLVPRDRIFSLLSLCGDLRLRVDYGISNETLFHRIIGLSESDGAHRCLSRGIMVLQTLNVWESTPNLFLTLKIPRKNSRRVCEISQAKAAEPSLEVQGEPVLEEHADFVRRAEYFPRQCPECYWKIPPGIGVCAQVVSFDSCGLHGHLLLEAGTVSRQGNRMYESEPPWLMNSR
jgi:hypothetical protein